MTGKRIIGFVLEIQFDYGDRQVSNRQELEELPFSSDADLEERIFQVCLAAGFEADFQSWRQALKAESVYHFFHESFQFLKTRKC